MYTKSDIAVFQARPETADKKAATFIRMNDGKQGFIQADCAAEIVKWTDGKPSLHVGDASIMCKDGTWTNEDTGEIVSYTVFWTSSMTTGEVL